MSEMQRWWESHPDRPLPGSRSCAIAGCTDRLYSRGWCSKHYQSWRRNGDPHMTPRRVSLNTAQLTPEERDLIKFLRLTAAQLGMKPAALVSATRSQVESQINAVRKAKSA